MWSLRRSGASSIMSSSDYDSSQGSNLVSSETSTVPSRLDSFSSSNGAVPCNDFNMQTSFDFDDTQVAIPTSPISSESSHDKQAGKQQQGLEVTSNTNSTADQSSSDNAEIAELESVQAERAVSPTIQKWVDESCVETERLKSAGRFSDGVAIKEEEIDEVEESPPSDFTLQQALEYSLRAVSPSFARTASLDAGFSALGDYHSQLTSTENMLLGLGFGGPDLGIPVRFLKSWREQIIKRKIVELQGLLERSRKSPSPTGSARQYAVKSPRGGELSPRKKPTTTEAVTSPEKKPSQNATQRVPSPKAAVKPSEKQLQLEKLNEMRRKLRKSATISSFSPSTLPDANQLLSGKDMKKKGAMSEKKYQKFRGATRGNAKDRRRKFGTRQSSLPISLETLPEEDEGRPAFLQQKSSSFDFVDNRGSSNNTSTATSVNSSKLDVRDEGTELDNVEEPINEREGCQKGHPTITVMSEPSEDGDQMLLFIPEIENQERGNSKAALDGKHLLAIKGIIESKDSGFGNDISNEGTPQLSPEHCPKSSEVKHGKKNELDLQDCPQNDEHSERLHADVNQGTLSSKTFDDRNKITTENEEEKKSQRVDLCIQVDFPEVTSDSESDVEYCSTGVQTSPWLQSGELSPLCCGHFTYTLNESAIDSSDTTTKHEREINVENSSHYNPSTAGDSQGQEGSSQESFSTNQEYSTQDLNPLECPKVVGESSDREPCADVALSDAKIDTTDQSVSLKEPNFLDGFNSEKRRLSRIEEVTESTLSHQSEEERTKNSFESQLDSVSSQATSTSSSSRPSSSLVLLGTDVSKPTEETTDIKPLKRAQSNPKKGMKQVYKEMLERNLAGDLSDEKDLLLLRTNYQAERCSAKLTVDETLLQAAQKLEMCAKDQNPLASPVDSSDAVDAGDDTSFTKIEKEEESVPSTETAPINEPVSHPEESLEFHSKSIGSSPNDQSGSQQSRRFFSTQSFSSITDAIKEVQSSRSNSNVSDATVDFELDSFFSVPIDLDVFEEEPDVNFSLTGSDMNLMSADEVNRHNPYDPEVASRIVTIPRNFSLEEVDDKYFQKKDKRRHLKDFHHGYTRNNYSDMISTISSVESGAFFSETINDEVSLGKEVFTQSLEVNVPRVSSEDAVFLSHRSISLSQKGREKSLSRTVPIFQEKQSYTAKVPFNYSSKYYFSVEDYSRRSDEDSENLVNRLDQLSRRRQSLINAHLAARGHVFDEIIDEVSLCQTENVREDHLPLMTVPRESDATGQRVGDNLTLGSFGEDKSVIRDGMAEFMAENERTNRAKKIERYGRQRSDKISGDSDLSLGSSINSSKVDDFVDLMLDNVLQEVISEEFSWNRIKNGRKPHGDPYFGGGNNKSMNQNCSSFENDSQSNSRTNMANGVFDDRGNHMKTTVYTPVEFDGRGEILPESISSLNDKFVSLKEVTLGQEKIHLDTTVVSENSLQNLNNGVSLGKHSEEKSLMSKDEICDGSHTSSVSCTNKDVIGKSRSTSMNSPHSVHNSNKEMVDIEHECNRANISLGSSERGSVNNGLHCHKIRNKLDLNKKECSLNSADSTLRALDKSSELMPSYDELYSKAENLISNLDALIAGNK